MVNLRKVLFTLTVCLCSFALSQDVTLTFYPDGNVSYTSDQSISGYQFDHDGCAASAEDATGTDFSVNASAGVVLAFSFSGTELSAGDDLPLLSGVTCSAADVGGIVISGPIQDDGSAAPSLSSIAVDGELPEVTCEDVGGNGMTCDQILSFGGSCGAMFGNLDVDEVCPAACGTCPDEGPEMDLVCAGDADVCIGVDSNGDVNFTSLDDLYGFQFSHNDCATDGIGTDENGFSTTISGTTAIGFSFSGTNIGTSGTLVSATDCSIDDLSNFVISGLDGLGYSSETGVYEETAVPVLTCAGDSDVCIGVNGDGDVVLSSSGDVYGFQMDHTGCEGIAISGVDSDSAGFSTSITSGLFFGFSFSGNFIPAGEMTIISGTDCTIGDLSGFTISGVGGSELSSEAGTYGDESACDDADADGVCDDVDDCVGQFDDCGVCDGDNSSCDEGCGPNQPGPSGCDNACGSALVNDECYVCGGDSSSCDDGCGPNQPGPSGCDNACGST